MKGTLMEVILAGVILSSGCATMTRATRLGAGSGAGEAMILMRGPTYGTGVVAADYHSLADHYKRRPSPAGLLGTAKAPPVLGPDESPSVEWGVLGLGVKGLPGAHIQRFGLTGYAKNWAETGLGRSLADVSDEIYLYVQLRVFPGGSSRMLMY